MWPWGTSSDPAGDRVPATRAGRRRAPTVRARAAGLGLLALGVALATPAPAGARVFLTVDEALDLAFPGCEVERTTVYLTEAQLARARELAGVEVPGALVHPYVARRGGRRVGTAYFDAHRVRTLPETLMVVVDPEGRVERLEILSFSEPEDYLPREVWYRQFLGRPLDEALTVGREIRGVTGATLTARATTEAVRRVLALHRVIEEAGGGGEGGATAAPGAGAGSRVIEEEGGGGEASEAPPPRTGAESGNASDEPAAAPPRGEERR